MGRYTGPKNKIARRFGVNLGLKTNAAKVAKRLNQKPGQHGARRRSSTSSFGKQLEEKQKAKFIYGLRERQFRGYVEEANRREGDSGVNLNRILESRLDNVVYRMGFASTRAEARQLVSHKAVMVNDQVVNIPSYLVKPGDVVSIRQKAKAQGRITAALALSEQRASCDWLTVDTSTIKGTFTTIPTLDEVSTDYNVNLVVELYSK